MTELRRLWNIFRSHAKSYAGAPRFATVHSNDGFKKKGQMYKKLNTFSKMLNYKYRMWCKETVQLISDDIYPDIPSKPIRDEVH
jgi:hypothetical protein